MYIHTQYLEPSHDSCFDWSERAFFGSTPKAKDKQVPGIYIIYIYMLGSKLPFFSYGRDGHQPYSRGLYTHYKDSLLKVG